MSLAVTTASSRVFANSICHPTKPIAVDLYCGVGGMGLGFEQAGFDIAAAVDIEEVNVKTHEENFPNCKAWRADLSSVSGQQLRKETGVGDKHIHVVFAGPPCQGFSLIGRRDESDPRNRLLVDLARLIGELSPSYFVVENVEGILLGNARRTLDEFLAKVQIYGYQFVEPIQVLDAAEFGVPQRRRRMFVLGYRNGLTAPLYPTPDFPNDNKGKTEGRPTVWDAIGDLPRISNYKYLFEDDSYSGELAEASAYARVLRGEDPDPLDFSVKRERNRNRLGGCLRTVHTLKTIARFRRTKPGSMESVSRFYRLSKNGLAPTLRAGTGPAQGSFMAPRPIHPFQDRCITVREAARLHSFPDWFQFHQTKWHGFRQIGNSVPPLLSRAVARNVLRAIQTKSGKTRAVNQ